MRIGIDYLPATSHAPGVGRYARELVRALVALDERPHLALFDVGRARRTVEQRLLGLTAGDPRARRVTRDVPRSLLALVARVLPVGADTLLGGVDVFHHVLHDGPPVVRALQTIALSELPLAGSPAEARLVERVAKCDRVFVFSRDFARRARARLRIAPDRLVVVPVGCEHWRRDLAELPERASPPRILVLGATRRARHPLAVLRAFELAVLDGLDATLVFCGRAGDAHEELRRALLTSSASSRVRLDPPFEERDAGRVVGSASLLVHLSDDEGTPVTPLEALALDVPVVASRLPSFEEALGGAAQLVDTDRLVREPAHLAAIVAQGLWNAADAAASARRAVAVREFTWQRCAEAHAAAWRALER